MKSIEIYFAEILLNRIILENASAYAINVHSRTPQKDFFSHKPSLYNFKISGNSHSKSNYVFLRKNSTDASSLSKHSHTRS
jgi:hypothetical protein